MDTNKKLNISAMIFWVFLLHIGSVALTPKIDFGFIVLYPLEPLFLLTIAFLLIKKRLKLVTLIEKNYLLFIAACIITYPIGVIYSDTIATKTPFLILKFSAYAFVIPIVYYFKDAINEKHVDAILKYQFLFIAAFGSYVIFNLVSKPIPMGEVIWGYSREYRLIGFTGLAVGLEGARQVGTTSVQAGILVAMLTLIYLSIYIHQKNNIYLIMFFAGIGGELLTQSRSGLLVLTVGVVYLFFSRIKNKRVISLAIFSMLSIAALAYHLDLFKIMSSFGTLSKVISSEGSADSSTQLRFKFMMLAYDFIKEKPWAIITGTGYGEEYTFELIGTPFLENLLFTALFQSGIIGFILSAAFFYTAWYYASKYSNSKKSNIYSSALYGIKIFMPGFFIVNCIGGNSLQTDFIAPLFFFLIGIGVIKEKYQINSNQTS